MRSKSVPPPHNKSRTDKPIGNIDNYVRDEDRIFLFGVVIHSINLPFFIVTKVYHKKLSLSILLFRRNASKQSVDKK